MAANMMSMQGKGYYNENSSLQQQANDKALELFQPIVCEGQSIVLADYGCSEGQNTVELLQKVLGQQSALTSATLVFVDTPLNDFSILSTTIDKSWSELTQKGKIHVNALMVPRSHFEQVLPDSFLDAGFSFTALHWLRQVPSWPVDRNALRSDAHSDLRAFLTARHRELRTGGTLTLCIPGEGSVGVKFALDCLYATIRNIADDYQVTTKVVDTIPMYYRSMEEILSAVEASTGDWLVQGHETVPIVHPQWSVMKEAQTETSQKNYAAAIAGNVLAAVSGFFQSEAKKNMGDKYPGDAVMLEDLHTVYQREWLKSFPEEQMGFTYQYIRLQKT